VALARGPGLTVIEGICMGANHRELHLAPGADRTP
jgi:hypothetical protein